jgi:V8-like Glu-specific endopeptidase
VAAVFGQRAFPPSVKATPIAKPEVRIPLEEAARHQALFGIAPAAFNAAQKSQLDAAVQARLRESALLVRNGLPGHVPDHLEYHPSRPRMDENLRRPVFAPSMDGLKPGESLATTIFPPDQRFTFSDTAYPWSCMGRVDLAGGFGSGSLVGPRHLLCASHMMTWNSNNTVNQVTFTPAYFDGNAPFGNSGIVECFFYRKVVGPTLQAADTAEDYVCLVLSQRLGDICGYLGTGGYDSSWNGLAVWAHVGYPGDLHGGARPSFQGGIPIDNTSGSSDDEDLWQKADIWPGQSGGPFFAQFPNESWPRACGVQSAQNAGTNSAGGGNYIPDMVNQARAAYP